MNNRYNLSKYRILRNLQYLQEQEEKNNKISPKYKAALAKKNNKETFTYNGKTLQVKDYIHTQAEADAIISQSEQDISELNYLNEKKKRKNKKADGMRSVKYGADNNVNVSRMDFLPAKVLKNIAKKRNKKIDEFVDQLDERKKRKKKYTSKNIPSNYKSKVSSKAISSMAREMNKCAKTPRPKSCYDYWDADKKHDKAMKESLDKFIEILNERKKKKSGSRKLSEKTRKALKKKAEKANMPLGALTSVYRKGLGAWLTGHRPGTPQHAWAMARVNSFIRGGKTRSVDKAEWKKVQKHRK